MIKKLPLEDYLKQTREKEISLAFENYKPGFFERGLEVGCGNGYQSNLIAKYCNKLIASDFNYERIKDNYRSDDVDYIKCDAENLENYFEKESFDLVFSSSLIEHLPSPEKYFLGAKNILKEGGILISVMPNVFWKVCQICLFYLNIFTIVVNKLARSNKKKTVVDNKERNNSLVNNQKSEKKYSRIRYFLWLVPHGEYKTNVEELFMFRKKRWVEEIEKAGFEVVKVKKGPVSSGYRFGFNKLRSLFEKIGFSSVYIYIAVKK